MFGVWPNREPTKPTKRLGWRSSWARRFGELREGRGWTQVQLAETVKMTQPAIARFEAGGTVPTLPVLERLTHALGAELVVRLAPRSAA